MLCGRSSLDFRQWTGEECATTFWGLTVLLCSMCNVKREDTKHYFSAVINYPHRQKNSRRRVSNKVRTACGFQDATLKAPQFIKELFFVPVGRDLSCSDFYDTQADSREHCMQVSVNEKNPERISYKEFLGRWKRPNKRLLRQPVIN